MSVENLIFAKPSGESQRSYKNGWNHEKKGYEYRRFQHINPGKIWLPIAQTFSLAIMSFAV